MLSEWPDSRQQTKTMRFLAASFVSLFWLTASAGEKPSEPVIAIQGATIVAFFNVTQQEVDEDEGLAEGLSDFQFYTERAAEHLKQVDVSMHQRYGDSFKVETGGETIAIDVPSGEHGYYFFAPSMPARAVYGISTDVDIVETAEEYFGLKANK